ncbi:MAG: long-chain acyl-CoA synthetase [Phycisphaerales bacterium]|nr:long-chain acyl-CoA synthetase [Phycisphaerales bacterium]
MLRCGNRCEYHVAFFAALSAGVVVFPVPPEINEREFSTLVAKCGAAAVIDETLNIHLLPHDDAADGPRDGLLLQSSGTTGLPKIVHRNSASLDAVAAQMVAAVGIEGGDRVLSCVPLCHSYGLEHGLLAPMFAGTTVHLADGFDIATVRSELAQSGITHFPAVPSVYEMLANVASDGAAFPSLRVAYSAGGPLPITLFEKLRSQIGLAVSQLYGATEVGSVTFSHADETHFAAASVGRAIDGVELRVDDDGQLLCRAKSMMSAYLGDESPLTPDGFFPTGDLARIDNHGNLFITGRLKLLIDVGGLKVNPLEVEQTILEHPAVAACVVVPMRLSETVFRLKAVITPSDPERPPTTEALRKFVRDRLTIHKVPRVFELRATLPRSATGKILRHLLAETA